jgi:luciferase family oxidoreductase group 1
MVPFSVLDLAPVVDGGDVADALARARDLARHAERLGYARYWLAEHHNMPGIASAATALVIQHVASATTTIRVGSGGIMLPNHAPLVIAEQFGTLAALFPGRIDLGLGRAPGTDQRTAHALRRGRNQSADTFPDDVVELQRFVAAPSPGQPVIATPGAASAVPIWLLGSSLFSAELAARLGLPFAFASHFAPDMLQEALEIYRGQFQPARNGSGPHAMACIGVYAAETDREAQRLFTSIQQSFVALRRGAPTRLPPPVDSMEGRWSEVEEAMVQHAFRESVVGSPETVRRGIEAFLARTDVDELMVYTAIYDQDARVRSYRILAEVRERLNEAPRVVSVRG